MSTNLSTAYPQLLLFGGFELRSHDGSLEGFSYVKMRALLAFLAMEVREHSRETLAELFWPDNDLTTARGNLRRTLADLRRALPKQYGEWFLVTKNSIRFISSASVDAKIFNDFCRKNLSVSNEFSVNTSEYIDLYKGEFLQGLTLPECTDFENWLLIQRESLHRFALALLEQECSRCESIGNIPGALKLAIQMTSHDPWNENGYYRAMQLHALSKQHSAALALYDYCCETLRKELGVHPSEPIRQLADSIRENIHSYTPGTDVQELTFEADKMGRRQIPLKAERRQVTVMYCELISQSIEHFDDPDDAMQLLDPIQASCIETITRYGGHVMQSHGGGFLAYFGYPQAHEYAARYAIEAALGLPKNENVEIHTSVHTGLILTGENSLTPDSIGRTSKIAIKLRHFATGKEVAVSEATHRLTEGYFEYTSLGVKEIFGFRPVLQMPIYTVVAKRAARTRFDAVIRLTPLVGRRSETGYLSELWERTKVGNGGGLLIQAEAGLGKSRLLHTLKADLSEHSFNIHELRCFPEFNQSPFHPLITMLESLLEFDQRQSNATRYALLERYLKLQMPRCSHDAISVIAYLLSLPEGDSWAVGISPQKLKEKTAAVLLEWLHSLSSKQPVLLIVEDLHWIDPSSLELLHTLIIEQQETHNSSAMVVMTARPEFIPPWSSELCPSLALNPLTSDEVREMVTYLVGDISMDAIKRIVTRADGVPLFVEELVKVAAGDKFTGVPDSLQDLLMERMDRLGKSRYTIQLAACLGREFSLPVLTHLTDNSSEELHRDLYQFGEAGLILTQDFETWQFKHALIRDAAYALQTKSDRQRAHKRIAQVLQDSFVELSESQPELLAQHWSAAGEPVAAIPFWIKSGQRAMRSSAILEAKEQFNSALQLLKDIPEGLERDRNEFAILTHFSPVLYAVYGYGSGEARQANIRIAELIARVGDSPELFIGKWSFVMSTIASGSAPNGGALIAAQQLLALPYNDAIHLQAAHHAVANAAFWCGQFEISVKHAELAVALFEPGHRSLLLQLCGTDLSIFSMSYLSCSLYFMGEVERAENLCEEKLAMARSIGHPHTLAQALSFASTLYRWIGKPDRVLELSVETIELSREHEFALWLACGEMTHGWALVRLGQAELGFSKLHSSVQGMRASLCGIPTVFISALAEAHLFVHQYQEAFVLLEEALASVTQVGDGGLYLAEVYRLHGECLFALSGSIDDALLSFERALTISHQQKALTLGLRAEISKNHLRSLR